MADLDLSPENLKIFQKFDKDGDGKISLAELTDALHKLGAKSDEVTSTMKEIDTDGDTHIDLKEFAVFCEANPGLMKDVAKIFAKD